MTPEQQDQIYGGEAALWSEYVDTTNILPRVLPFVGAIAERLWSPPESSTTDDAMHRLDELRCLLLWYTIKLCNYYIEINGKNNSGNNWCSTMLFTQARISSSTNFQWILFGGREIIRCI